MQEQGEVSSAECFSDIPAYVLSRLNLTQEKSCCKDKETEYCQNSQSGMMCELSTGDRGEEKSTASAAAFLVPTSLLVEKEKALKENTLVFGVKWRELSMRYDQDTHSLKTVQCSMFEESTECYVTLPAWGTMQDGVLWEGNVWAKPKEKEYGFWGSPVASVWLDFRFKKEQILKSKFGAQQNRFTTQYLKSTGELPSPLMSEWIMEFPIGWTDLKPLEGHKFQAWQQQHLWS